MWARGLRSRLLLSRVRTCNEPAPAPSNHVESPGPGAVGEEVSLNEKVREFTEGGWEQDVLGAERPVLVDFWAEWCSPCRMLGPTIDQVAVEFEGRVTVGKLNVDDHSAIAERYGVRSIPTLLVFHGGRVVEQRVGLMSKAELVRMLEARVAAGAVAR